MANKSRTVLAAKNFIWGTVGNVINSLLSFLSRTVFIYTLGTVYLGVNGLFSNILGMLSFAELGFGSAISFSLYKPLAERNVIKLQAIINFYRTAYRVIATVVAVAGIVLIPFLKYIVKGAEGIDNIEFIYCLFLFNTVTSYLITYKSTLLSADQYSYLITNINTIVKVITMLVQIVLLIIFKNFIIYLLANTIIQLFGKTYINHFTDKRYPYIKGKNNSKLTSEEKRNIFAKVKALIFHKVGEISIYQTDNILTSIFINVSVVGLVSNFTMIINLVNTFIMSFFNGAIAGLGNIVATEVPKRRLEIFKNYDFIAFWFFGWSTICLYFLLSPFITVWIGNDKLIDGLTIALLCANYYMTGSRVSVSNLRDASGAYEYDKWIAIIQALVNVIVSIVGVKLWGLPGIYIGTIVSSLLPNIIRPIVVYKYVFETSCKEYFIRYAIRVCILGAIIAIIKFIIIFINFNNGIINLCFIAIVCMIVPNVIIAIIFRKQNEFSYIKSKVNDLVVSKIRRNKIK